MTAYVPVGLDDLCTATAMTSDAERARGAANAWGNSFPAEELPRGTTLVVGGVPYVLPGPGAPGDNVEAYGQLVPLPVQTRELAVLCFGEMGDQEVTVGGATLRVPGWAAGAAGPGPDAGPHHCASHLHYPGGYELAQLRPVLWSRAVRLPEPAGAVRLGRNPLCHVVAVCCARE